MGTTIKHKRTITNSVPTSLAPGEIALDTKLGYAWYGDEANQVKLLSSSVLSTDTTPVLTTAINGAFWWHPTQKALRMFEGGAWHLVGMPTTGGTFTGHIIVVVAGDEKFRTNAAGSKTTGNHEVTGSVIVGGDLEVTGSVDLGGSTLAPSPTGTIIQWAGDIWGANANPIPTGWLLADGTLYPVSTHPKLGALLGHGYTENTQPQSHFRVPDVRGLFPRFWNHNRANDGWSDPELTSRVANHVGAPVHNRVGTIQQNQNLLHQHKLGYDRGQGGGQSGTKDEIGATYTVLLTTADGGAESRPKNMALMGLIKT